MFKLKLKAKAILKRYAKLKIINKISFPLFLIIIIAYETLWNGNIVLLAILLRTWHTNLILSFSFLQH